METQLSKAKKEKFTTENKQIVKLKLSKAYFHIKRQNNT